MSNADIRKAHKLLDYVSQGRAVLDEEIELLRSFLPELPKQKTLEELRHAAYAAWSGTHGNKWLDDVDGDLETWLYELHQQLKGLAPAKPAHPEFLETEADYRDAPIGTIVIREGGYPWTRIFGSWVAYSRNDYSHSEMAELRGKARVLRWGDGK